MGITYDYRSISYSWRESIRYQLSCSPFLQPLPLRDGKYPSLILNWWSISVIKNAPLLQHRLRHRLVRKVKCAASSPRTRFSCSAPQKDHDAASLEINNIEATFLEPIKLEQSREISRLRSQQRALESWSRWSRIIPNGITSINLSWKSVCAANLLMVEIKRACSQLLLHTSNSLQGCFTDTHSHVIS